ncbi:35921_t:CDS:2, partial [Racocetra persica]
RWCLVVAGVIVGVVVITGLLSSLDFSGILVNLCVSPAFLWNGFAFFSSILISDIFFSYGACLVFVGSGNCVDIAF